MLGPSTILQSRYRLLRPLGSGGMGDVYLAEDTRLTGRQCAIKGMSPAALPPADRNWAITAFRQEAQMLATLRHRGLTEVMDFFAEGSSWYLVMEYVQGITLEQRLQQAPGQRLPVQEALTIIYQLCNVLDYLHQQNPPVIFRDLKPANVMLTPQGEVKLIDFGIARFFKPGKAQDTVNLGTPGYAAPEQHGQGGQTDARSDVYSLGVLLHQILTGHDPTTTVFSLPSARSLNPAIPPAGEAVIARATQLDPNVRFQSVAEFRQALFLATPTPTTQMPAVLPATIAMPGPAGPTVPTSNKRLWIGLALLAVISAGLVVALISQSGPGSVTPATATSIALSGTVSPATVDGGSSGMPVQSGTSAPPPSAAPSMPTVTPNPTSTMRPTSTPRPTVTPRPSDTPAPACPGISGPFATLGLQLQDRLGCASGSAYTVQGAAQVFENGRMYWRGDNRMIYAIVRGGHWEAYNDTWVEGDPPYSCQADTPGVPVRGFGRVWCNHASVRNGLGKTKADEYAINITAQQFVGGLIIQTDDRVLAIYNDGSWERH